MNWENFAISESPEGWALLAETGWHSMLILTAGPGRIVRTVKRSSAEHQVEIDDTIDEYLREASILPRPRGYDWFIELPPATSLEDIDAVLNESVRFGPSAAPTARQVFLLFENTVHTLY